ncbi:MAG TPA: 3-hydroxyacyl-CoA dehydrogenase NAD-binding domain-containing protein, partial [Burkholderiales bacterium]
MDTPIQTVLIYGYGVMGRGVAKTFADAGFTTLVKSSRAGKLAGLPTGTVAVERLPAEAPDLVIEFVPEEVSLKQSVYAEIEAAYSSREADKAPLIASGTSGLDLVELARNMAHPERFLGVHYF